MSQDPTPMPTPNPERDGNRRDEPEELGFPVDPVDPLKRDETEDGPGLDPTPAPLPAD